MNTDVWRKGVPRKRKTYPEYQTLVFSTNCRCKFCAKRSSHSFCALLTSLLIAMFPALKISGTVIRRRLFMVYLFWLSEISTVICFNSPNSRTLNNLCTSRNMKQLITQPTRVTETSKTLIDVIFTSNPALIIVDSGIVGRLTPVITI